MDAPERILLVGMMGAGKTTVGRALARRLGRPFVDNDHLVRELTGRAPEAIDAESGEEALHAVEVDAFRTAVARPDPAVIAVASAVVDRVEERARLRDAGFVVWLRARPAVLRDRIGSGAGRREDATDLSWLAARAAERAPVYAGVADLVVDVDSVGVDAVVERILSALARGSHR